MRFLDVADFASLHPFSALVPARKHRCRGQLRAGTDPKDSLSRNLRNLELGVLSLTAF